MSIDSDASSVNRREFLALASSAAAAGALSVGKPSGLVPSPLPPPTPYSVTIDITTSPISYSVGGHHAYRLKVNAGDSVTWKAKTNGSTHHLAILFLKETPLSDASNQPLYAVHGSEVEETGSGIGGTIDSDASGTYEYYVAVFDGVTKKTYTDDPKIIVGTGNLEAEAELALALDDLKTAGTKLSSKPKQRQQLESIERELEHLMNELNDVK
jgi:plastocyanin